jgi:hypothetical protein
MNSIDFLHKARAHFRAEPRLGNLMSDPIMHSMMACDGVRLDTLTRLISETQRKLRVNCDHRRWCLALPLGGNSLDQP